MKNEENSKTESEVKKKKNHMAIPVEHHNSTKVNYTASL